MYLSLVYYLDVGTEKAKVEVIRDKHDPTSTLMPAHVPILFPVPGDVVGLEEHVQSIVDRRSAFPIRLRGFEKSPDHWLLLKVDEGREELVGLFDAVYTGPLAAFRRADLTYNPHVGLGLFVRADTTYDMRAAPRSADLDQTAYEQALHEAEAADIDIRSNVTKLHLVELDDDVLAWARGTRSDLPPSARARTRKVLDLKM